MDDGDRRRGVDSRRSEATITAIWLLARDSWVIWVVWLAGDFWVVGIIWLAGGLRSTIWRMREARLNITAMWTRAWAWLAMRMRAWATWAAWAAVMRTRAWNVWHAVRRAAVAPVEGGEGVVRRRAGGRWDDWTNRDIRATRRGGGAD